LIDLVMRAQVHRPLALIRRTMERAADGELAVRAPRIRDDELGFIGRGLNDMLGRLEHSNAGLQEQIRDATDELRLRNIQIAESYQRTLALRETLGRSERMAAVGQVAARVAHQVGTPLNLISGYIQMIREEWRADTQTTQRLQIVDAQIQQVTRILRTLLDEARQPSIRDVTSIEDVVAHVCELATPSLARTGVTLQVSLTGALPPIAADRVQLELALLNLVSNALDAMPGGGVLRVSTTSADSEVTIVLSDSGAGIPPELLPRVFDPWVTTKPEGRGTGLGLSITRDVITRFGGTVDVASEPGHGATFTIRMPADAGRTAHDADAADS
jgi:two-component system, NtrC family, sensor kinase